MPPPGAEPADVPPPMTTPMPVSLLTSPPLIVTPGARTRTSPTSTPVVPPPIGYRGTGVILGKRSRRAERQPPWPRSRAPRQSAALPYLPCCFPPSSTCPVAQRSVFPWDVQHLPASGFAHVHPGHVSLPSLRLATGDRSLGRIAHQPAPVRGSAGIRSSLPFQDAPAPRAFRAWSGPWPAPTPRPAPSSSPVCGRLECRCVGVSTKCLGRFRLRGCSGVSEDRHARSLVDAALHVVRRRDRHDLETGEIEPDSPEIIRQGVAHGRGQLGSSVPADPGAWCGRLPACR